MAYMSWRNNYEVGVPLVDMEHHYLFDLINEYHDKSSSGASHADAVHVLNKLVSYAQTHFLHEETLMHMNGYPKLAQHGELHASLFISIFSLNEKYAAEPDRLGLETLRFLKHWLVEHILKEDMDIGDFMRRKVAHTEKTAQDTSVGTQVDAVKPEPTR